MSSLQSTCSWSCGHEARCPQPPAGRVWGASAVAIVTAPGLCFEWRRGGQHTVGRGGRAVFAARAFSGRSWQFRGCPCHLQFPAVGILGWASSLSPCWPLNLKGWGCVSLVRKGDIASEDRKQPLLKHVWPQVCSFIGLFPGVPSLPLISVFS